ncbi:MAG TPA: putative quinol monooxygenase [Cyanophyceae cyanobacterium]
MSNQQVTVTARIRIKPGLEEKFKEEYRPILALTRAEQGCINYDLHQSANDPSLFMLHENWANKEILEQHLAMPYMKALGEKAEEFLAEPPEVMVWQPISDNT